MSASQPMPQIVPQPMPDAESFFADLVTRHASDGVIISDPEQRALWVNPAFTAQTGYVLGDILGKEPGSLLQGRDTDPEATARIRQACAQRRAINLDILNYTKAGEPFWIDLKVMPVYDSTGRHTHFISTMRDITERKALEEQNEAMRHSEQLRQSERHLLALTSEWLYSAKSLDELLMVIQRAMHTLIPEADGALYIYDNTRTSLKLATSWGNLPGFPSHMLPDECWALRRGRAYAFGLKPIQFTCEHVRNSGAPYFCLPIIAHGETIGLMHIVFEGFEEGGIMRHMRDEVLRNRWDISLICGEQISLAIANVRLRQELHDRSVRDPLTGLWNRRWFMERATREFSIAADENRALALVSIDVDHFKSFNDRFGHEAGDLVLREVGRVLRTAADDTVHPCRFGGEEFVLLCLDHDQNAIHQRAEALREAIAALKLASGGQVLPQITVSAGYALFGHNGTQLDTVLKASDRALYRAKDEGRNRVVSAVSSTPTAATETP